MWKSCGKAGDCGRRSLPKASRVSRQTVSSIENGRYSPSLELAFTISDFFGLPIEEIFLHERSDMQ